eukprot:NODE_21126_length_768_cov_1.048362.p5 GENE.NODE_21126_length_768_cov_1.048362~~NODE_21126_length_768_cov_1.048362.p5  ORF type:complete len:60 (-),score=11.94 NODE_21126_length_768_cov_1.048362:261-440(-)
MGLSSMLLRVKGSFFVPAAVALRLNTGRPAGSMSSIFEHCDAMPSVLLIRADVLRFRNL